MAGRADTTAQNTAAPTRAGAFGALLKQHRVTRRLSQEALAERAGLSADAISALESGRRRAPYRDTVALLARALDLSAPDRATLEAAVPRRRGPAVGARSAWHNLPAPPTALLGREADVAHGVALLRGPAVRLLTLTGPGGVGKTRLAWQIAHEFAADTAACPDGAWLVELAPLVDPALVLPTVARTLGLREAPGTPLLATLTVYLAAKRLLLVLDNCEHLIEACAGLAGALLRACASLRLLATSREGLAIPGETRVRVPALPFPDPDHLPPLAALPGYPAVALLQQRARAQAAPLALTAQTAPAVAQICARLDGLPLALELAAARLTALSPAQVAARLDDCFRLLGGDGRAAVPRQQTLQATVGWSYGLLMPQEQTLFTRLAVFAGGWRLEAAEAVGAGGTIAPAGVLELLGGLVNKSLVVAEAAADGDMRYRLLETLRQYGCAQLAAGDEAAPVRGRHAAYHLALAEHAECGLTGPDQLRWLDRLERELDNVRAALAWCLDAGAHEGAGEAARAAETGLRLAGALLRFWLFRDHHREGLAWLEHLLPRGAVAPAVVRAKALCSAGVCAGQANEPARAQALLADSVALSRAVGDRRQLSLALSNLGWATWRNGQEARAAAPLAEGLALARAAGEPGLIAHALMHDIFRVANSAAIARAEERARAWAGGTEALRLFAGAGDTMNRAMVQLHLGQIARHEGDDGRARAAFAASLPLLRRLGWQSEVARALIGLAEVARAQGDDGAATARYAAALALYRRLEDPLLLPTIAAVLARLAALALARGAWGAARRHVAESLASARDTARDGTPYLAGALEVQAVLAAVQGAPLRAVRLAGAAAALRAHRHQPLPAAEQAALERRLAPARQALGADAQAGAWAAGQAMTPEQALVEALAGLPSGTAPPRRA